MAENEEPGIVIGLREIYNEVVATRSDVQSVTRTVADHDETMTAYDARFAAHDAQFDKIKRWMYALPIASLLAVGSTVAAFVQSK